MKRKLGWIVAGLVVAGGAVFFAARPSAPPPAAKYETTEVTRGPVVARVTASGTLSPLVTVQVGTQVSGRILHLFADFNSAVTKGQVVAKIDPQLFQAAVEQQRANHAAARANLAKAKAQAVDARKQYERAKRLVAAKYVPEADVDTAEATLNVALAQIDAASGALQQATAAMRQAEVNLEYTTIVSPIDGVVISRNVDVGQTVAAALQAPTLFTIAQDLGKMQVHCNVAEADIGRLAAAMPVTFTVDAWPSERFAGVIHEVRNSPQTIQNVVTYDAVIDVENPDLKLKPGMTANVTFVVADREDALRIPNAALRFRPPPDMAKALTAEPRGTGTLDRRTAWLLRDDAPVPVALKVGITDGTVTEVLDGDLKAGDRVVTDVTGDARADPAARMRRPF
jgi:HlyD family secretion protein